VGLKEITKECLERSTSYNLGRAIEIYKQSVISYLLSLNKRIITEKEKFASFFGKVAISNKTFLAPF